MQFLGGIRRVLFVPFALFDRNAYGAKFEARVAAMGLACEVLDARSDPAGAVDRAEALFVGGGNTFRLLKALQDAGSSTPSAAGSRRECRTSVRAPDPSSQLRGVA